MPLSCVQLLVLVVPGFLERWLRSVVSHIPSFSLLNVSSSAPSRTTASGKSAVNLGFTTGHVVFEVRCFVVAFVFCVVVTMLMSFLFDVFFVVKHAFVTAHTHYLPYGPSDMRVADVPR